MAAIARVLLPFPAHAVHAGLLGTVDQSVQRSVEQALQGRFRAANLRRLRPSEGAALDADIADCDRALGIADVQLQPAQRFVVKCLEVIQALSANETRPAEKMR